MERRREWSTEMWILEERVSASKLEQASPVPRIPSLVDSHFNQIVGQCHLQAISLCVRQLPVTVTNYVTVGEAGEVCLGHVFQVLSLV